MLQMWTIRPVYSKLFIFIYLECLFLWLRHILRNWFAESCADSWQFSCPSHSTVLYMFWNKFTFSGKYFGEETVQKRKSKVMSSFSFVGKKCFLCNFKGTESCENYKGRTASMFLFTYRLCFDRFRAFFRRVQSRTALSITELLITVLFVKALSQSWVTIILVYI